MQCTEPVTSTPVEFTAALTEPPVAISKLFAPELKIPVSKSSLKASAGVLALAFRDDLDTGI